MKKSNNKNTKRKVLTFVSIGVCVAVIGGVSGYAICKNIEQNEVLDDLVQARKESMTSDKSLTAYLADKGVYLSSNGTCVFDGKEVSKALTVLGEYEEGIIDKKGVAIYLKEHNKNIGLNLYQAVTEDLKRKLGTDQAIEIYYDEYEDSPVPIFKVYNPAGDGTNGTEIELSDDLEKETREVMTTIYYLNKISNDTPAGDTIRYTRDALVGVEKYCTIAQEEKVLKK